LGRTNRRSVKISVKACDFVFAWMPGLINWNLKES